MADNIPSHRVLEKLGAELLGLEPNKHPKWAADRLLAHYRMTSLAAVTPLR